VEVADGMDFFYQNKSHALKMLDFVSSVLPVRNRGASEKLISADTKSATANVQMTCACPPPPAQPTPTPPHTCAPPGAPPAIIAIEQRPS
jgi:NMD protein affecting ribosome stability and mRNA decay